MNAFPQFLQGYVDKYKNRRLLQVLHGIARVNGAAAGGNHGVLAVQGQQNFALYLLKRLITTLVNNVLQATLGTPLYQHVGIDKIFCQRFGQQYTNGAFAGAGHADQNDIGARGVCH